MVEKSIVLDKLDIKNRIYTIRGQQVMLDADLAVLYGVKTHRLNEQVKRNNARFPKEFMFQLTEAEFEILRSQFVTSKWTSQFATSNYDKSEESQNLTSQFAISSWKPQKELLKGNYGGTRHLPYAFTEQGVAMLSGVLKSDTAVKISVQIINAFVSMRKFIASNALLFQRLDSVELKQLEYKKETNQKFDEIFDAIENKEVKVKQGVFFDGQIFDAYTFVSDLIRTANKSIILIDNFVDDSVLSLFNKRKKEVSVVILTKNVSKELALDLEKYNSQYASIVIKEFDQSHDRFLIIDNKEVYHFGASLKDLGKKWFAFSKFDKEAFKILEKVEIVKKEAEIKK